MTNTQTMIADLPLGMLGKGQADQTTSGNPTFDPSLLMFTETGTVVATGLDGESFTIEITLDTGALPYIHPIIVTGITTSGTTAPNLKRVVL